MKHTRMFMALLLCLAMILPACSQTQTENPSDTTAPTADTTVSDADSPYDVNGFLKTLTSAVKRSMSLSVTTTVLILTTCMSKQSLATASATRSIRSEDGSRSALALS